MTRAERRAWRDGIDPTDLPYGPGNPDYEHDDARQRDDDDAAEAAHHRQDLLRQQEKEIQQ